MNVSPGYLMSVINQDIFWYLKAHWTFDIMELNDTVTEKSILEKAITIADTNKVSLCSSYITNNVNNTPTWNMSVNNWNSVVNESDKLLNETLKPYIVFTINSVVSNNIIQYGNISNNGMAFINYIISSYFLEKEPYTLNKSLHRIISNVEFVQDYNDNLLMYVDTSKYDIKNLIKIVRCLVHLGNEIDRVFVTSMLTDYCSDKDIRFYLEYSKYGIMLLDFFLVYCNLPIFLKCWKVNLDYLCDNYWIKVLYSTNDDFNEVALKFESKHIDSLTSLYNTVVIKFMSGKDILSKSINVTYSACNSYTVNHFNSYWKFIKKCLDDMIHIIKYNRISNKADDKSGINNCVIDMSSENKYKKDIDNEIKLSMGTYTMSSVGELIMSSDPKERLIGEYVHLTLKINEIKQILEKGVSAVTTQEVYDLYHKQLVYMEGYQSVLEQRAKNDNIDLSYIIPDNYLYVKDN